MVITGCSTSPIDLEYNNGALLERDLLFQVSTIDALLEGVYDGTMSISTLKQYGDFGIGTFADLDGEMVELDYNFYQVKTDGVAYKVSDSEQTPFAVVTLFDVDQKENLSQDMDYKELENYIDNVIPTINAFYAIKIEGDFKYMKTRSVPAQEKPYPKLSDVAEHQSVFEFQDISGTIVGFRCPSYINGINVPGYHLHFIDSDRDSGGHVLEFIVEEATATIDYTSQFILILPGEDSDFYNIDLGKDKQNELERIEK